MILTVLAIIYSLVTIAGYPAYLLVPEASEAKTQLQAEEAKEASEDLPAVLLMHDHGAYYAIGKEKMCSPKHFVNREMVDSASVEAIERSVFWVNKLYDGMYLADSLAAEGFVVLVTDAPGWGSHREYEGDWSEEILRYDSLALEYLYNRPEVDKKRIATAGFSMGAYRAWMLAAKDERVSACAAFHWMTSSQKQGKWCRLGDFAGIAAGIAPRPFLLVAGSKDHLFNIDDVRACASRIDCDYREVPYDHVFPHSSWEMMRDFLLSPK